jgi:hypothetical protein
VEATKGEAKMTISEIQSALRTLENKQWPDHTIMAVHCDIWEDSGRWLIEAIPAPPIGSTAFELFLGVLAEPTVYKFHWPENEHEPSSSADAESAFALALAYVPSHPELNTK